jgi:hypothetical protein
MAPRNQSSRLPSNDCLKAPVRTRSRFSRRPEELQRLHSTSMPRFARSLGRGEPGRQDLWNRLHPATPVRSGHNRAKIARPARRGVGCPGGLQFQRTDLTRIINGIDWSGRGAWLKADFPAHTFQRRIAFRRRSRGAAAKHGCDVLRSPITPTGAQGGHAGISRCHSDRPRAEPRDDDRDRHGMERAPARARTRHYPSG